MATGVYRFVVIMGRYAIKFARSRSGVTVNRCEHEVWTHWAERFPAWRPLLAPVLWIGFGGWVLVMRRCKLPPADALDYMLRDDVLPHPAPPWEHSKLDDFGLLDGRIVAVDYGTTVLDRDYLRKHTRTACS